MRFSSFKCKNTKPEVLVRKYLFANGLRYRLYDRRAPDKPDIVLAKCKTVVFIKICFWKRDVNCKYEFIPKKRTEFGLNKM
ncbi:hypothetical protein [Chryseobacterium sp. PET-29]|uniref:hypothetical protein n=1 Tax=Chryseobacterium sp. PET-29 TaxID=2983267 RepID=UPI00398FFD9A